jgi:hypothetical protein
MLNVIVCMVKVAVFYIREAWQTLALHYLINYQYKSNNWTIVNILREK